MIRKGYAVRIWALFGFCFFVYVLIMLRLAWIQIIKKKFFEGLAAEQHLAGVCVSSPRGNIFDRLGQEIVVNREVVSAFIVPSHDEKSRLNKFLQEYYPSVFARMNRFPDRYFFWLDRRLTPDKRMWLEKFDISEIKFTNESARFYPYRELAPIVGFTDIDNKGIAGLELAFDVKLSGKSAFYKQVKDARAKRMYFDQTVKKKGVASDFLKITIDHKLQYLIYKDLVEVVDAFRAKQGSAIVLDPFSGEVLAMVSYPCFDPNNIEEVDLAQTKNTVLTECFEPGSIMKTFAALAALEEKVVSYDEEFDCAGKVAMINGLRVENWKSLGVMPFFEAIKNSSNVVSAKIGLRLESKLYEHLIRLGFGQKTELGFPGERSGFVNHPNNWSRSSVMVMTFGYELTANLLQIARAMGVIANGGHYVEPTLLCRDVEEKKILPQRQLYSEKSIQEITSILELVGARYPIPGFKLKGKTGTARLVVNKQYSTTQHIYTFAGFVAKDDYRRVIVACIKEPEKAHLWAADVVAPLVRKIAEKLAIKDFSNG